MNWKKFGLQLIILFAVALGSSIVTWHWMTPQKEKPVSWKEYLELSLNQQKKFSALESEFNLALKDIAVYDAQNKIALCAYLHSSNIHPKEIKTTTQKIAQNYGVKQEKIAMTLISISEILNPEQKKKFTDMLMHELCISCKKTTGTEKCLCGICEHHS